MRSPRPRPLVAWTLLGWLAGGGLATARPKTDVVELGNGDHVTCEIVRLDHGKLTVKTDDMGTIAIEWDNVARVSSDVEYDVEISTGVRYFGTLLPGDAGTLVVTSTSGQTPLPLLDVVRLDPVGVSFWRRLDGSLDGGYNFSQSNGQTQFTLNTNVQYRSLRQLSQLTASSLLTTQDDADRQTRNTLTLTTQRFIRPRWSTLGFGQFQQNEQLSLNLRAVFGGGLARRFLQSNHTILAGVAGVAFTREQYVGEDDRSVAEAIAGLDWDFFSFDGRSTNLSFQLMTFYALSGGSRTRLELNSSFQSDIVGDLYWSLNVVESFTSDPPAGQKRNDLGVSATVGWKF